MAHAASVFIGCSSEALPVAVAVSDNLDRTCDVTIWKHDIFQLTVDTMSDLIEAANNFDFGIFILAPDDEIVTRGQKREGPRDNVIFESGLFLGSMGRKRVFFIAPEGYETGLPTDLAGITIGRYRNDRVIVNAASATASVCERIRRRVEELGARESKLRLADFAAAVCYRREADKIMYCLIKTTKDRWAFPKGLVMSGEMTAVAALRYAEDEGAIRGRINFPDTRLFKNLKSETGIEQTIVAHLVERNGEVQPTEIFRNPTWFNLSEAVDAVTQRRPARYAEEMRGLLIWANEVVTSSIGIEVNLAGALPFRYTSQGVEVLLVTSRTSGNWLTPKGHLDKGEDASAAALREAWEEAGIRGKTSGSALGSYRYRRESTEYCVQLFPMEVDFETNDYPDSAVRKRKWFDIRSAAEAVHEVGLRDLIVEFGRAWVR